MPITPPLTASPNILSGQILTSYPSKLNTQTTKIRTVNATHPNLLPFWAQYQTIHDCLRGELYVKDQAELHLPRPDAFSEKGGDPRRYLDYIKRASFLGDVSSRSAADSMPPLTFRKSTYKPDPNTPNTCLLYTSPSPRD